MMPSADGSQAGRDATRLCALVVDDEPPLRQLVTGYLEREGFDVRAAVDGQSAVRMARELDPDVIVLDVMMPGLDGIEACRQIRTFSDAYVVMLTARDEEVDTLIGLSVGADDYITKPFSPRELVARVKTLMRRPRTSTAEATGARAAIRVFGDLEIDPGAREARLAGDLVDLTRTEFDLLETLSAEPRVAFSRRRLLERVWGEWYGDDHVVDVHVANLRRKLGDDAASARYVRTVRGVGYRMGEL